MTIFMDLSDNVSVSNGRGSYSWILTSYKMRPETCQWLWAESRPSWISTICNFDRRFYFQAGGSSPFCEKRLSKPPEVSWRGSRERWATELRAGLVHQTYRLARGSVTDCTKNNTGAANKSSLAVIDISHGVHHQQLTVPREACFIGGRVQTPRLPKKFVNWHKHFSNPFSATDFPYPPSKRLMCCERFIGTHWSNLHATPAHPRWLLCPGEMCLETEARKNHLRSRSSHNSLCLGWLSRGR